MWSYPDEIPTHDSVWMDAIVALKKKWAMRIMNDGAFTSFNFITAYSPIAQWNIVQYLSSHEADFTGLPAFREIDVSGSYCWAMVTLLTTRRLFSYLTKLSIHDTKLDSAITSPIQDNCRQIKELTLLNCGLGNMSELDLRDLLAAFPATVDYLNLGFNNMTWRERSKHSIRHLVNLKWLYLAFNNLGDDARGVVAALPDCVECLYLCFNKWLSSQSVPNLMARCQNLTNLDMSSSNFSGGEIDIFGNLPPCLEVLGMCDCGLRFTEPCPQLTSHRQLRQLNLYNRMTAGKLPNAIDKSCLCNLMASLPPTLTRLNLPADCDLLEMTPENPRLYISKWIY